MQKTTLFHLFVLANVLTICRGSLKHPVHGRNQRVRSYDDKNSLHYQLDNTDFFKDNQEPIMYRPSMKNKDEPHEGIVDQGLGTLLDTWTQDNVKTDKYGTKSSRNATYTNLNRKLEEDWLTWEEAYSVGVVGSLRVTFVTEFWDQDEDQLEATEHCAYENQIITPARMTSVTVDNSASLVCSEDDVVTNVTVGIVKQRLEWVKSYVADTFQVKRAQSSIDINSAAQENYPFSSTSFTDTDLVIVVTLHPVVSGGVAGYAYCAQSDQFGRCIVGYFNWVPDGLSDSSTFFQPNIAMSERTTALHEVMHVIGCCKDSKVFVDAETGEEMADSDKWIIEIESATINKQVTKWVTPGVVAVAREQYGCDTINGVPLEDVPLGSNAHWEARITGPDVMSYGIGSGEAYVSALTLIFFNDTNQYIVDLQNGSQRIFPGSGVDDVYAENVFSEIFSNAFSDTSQSLVLENFSYSPGYLRWGRHMGCSFFENPPSMDNWGADYFCTENSEPFCTPDHLMSASCYLLEYSNTANSASETYYARSDSSPSDTYNVPNDNAPYLPSEYQYLVAYDLTNWGGYSESMDYAPVRYGIWNCQDQEPTLEDARSFEDVEFVDESDLFTDLTNDIASYGGQIFSSHSRCFKSSLLLFSEAQYFNFEFESYGLCYLSNCYTEDYLQIGVKTAVGGVKWFRCEKEGSLYISGFIGSFTCPDPAEFCSVEDISGVKYAENNETLEWIFWGVLLGVMLILFIVFCCCRKARRSVAKKLKALMNFDMSKKSVQPKRRSPGGVLLTIICAVWHIVGIGLIAIGVIAIIDTGGTILWDTAVRQSYHFIGLGIVVIILATLGSLAAKANGPTLKAAIYFYIVLFLAIAFLFLLIIVFASEEWLEVVVEGTWNSFQSQFPDSWQLLTAQEAWLNIQNLFLDNSVYFYIVIGWNAFSMLTGLIVTFVMLTFQNVMGTMFFWMNIVILIAGAIFVWACSVIATVLPEEDTLLVGLLVPGCLTIICSIVGVVTCRKIKTLIAYMIVGGITFIAMLIDGIWLLMNIETNALIVDALTEEQLGQLVIRLEFFASEWTEEELRSWVRANLMAAGVAALVLSFIILGTIGAAAIIFKSATANKKMEELKEASKRMDLTGNKEWERNSEAERKAFYEAHGIELSNLRVEPRNPDQEEQDVSEIRFAERISDPEAQRRHEDAIAQDQADNNVSSSSNSEIHRESGRV